MLKECQINEIVIKPILVISNEEYKDILLKDLKNLFILVDFGGNSYNLEDFEFKIPDDYDKKIIKSHSSMRALAFWDYSKNIKNIYFTVDYFNSEEKERISYFFHEICHFIGYSLMEECKDILTERIKIDNLHNQESKNQFGLVSSQELVKKYNYTYLLTLFNEQLTDRFMLKFNPELFKIKLKSNINSNDKKIESACYLWHSYIIMMDIIRSIEIIKNKSEYYNEFKDLQKLLEISKKKLKEDCGLDQYNILIEYKDKLISSYEAKSASVTIDTFNELISKLINVD